MFSQHDPFFECFQAVDKRNTLSKMRRAAELGQRDCECCRQPTTKIQTKPPLA